MSEPAVLTEVEGTTLWITLNRPEAMNAMSAAVVAGLDTAVDEIERDARLRVAVITGAGRAFSAGGDLKAFRENVSAGRHDRFLEDLRRAQDVFDRVEKLRCPVIAAVNGAAVAGGLELILCCDLVIAAESARIGDGHATWGLIPGGGSTARLPRRVPPGIAKMLLLTGELWPARALLPSGLVNEVVADDQLRPRVAALAEQLAANSPLGLAWIKRLADGGRDQPVETAARAELAAFESYAKSADLLEGLTAFEEKRKPRFTGR
ncbi:MAG TPA: enoyl-CoA hydratase/isomerase family protein [Stellaceae bacterium]|nr:enoyl-CoA hydratase/isomerase family protein [Stellaceae bacterium]